MSNTIKLKRGSGSDPGASDLAVGEVALRTDTAKLFTKKDDNSVAEIGAGLADKIEEGNSKVEVVDSGTGYVTTEVDGTEVMRSLLNQTTIKYLRVGEAWTMADDTGVGLSFATSNLNDVIKSTANNGFIIRTSSLGILQTGSPNNYYATFNNNGCDLRVANVQKLVINSSGTTLHNDLLSGTDSTHDIGTTSNRFANIYGDTIYGDGSNLTNLNIVTDTSPQLGGDLDVQSSKITTATSNGNVKIEPNGTGVVEIRGAGGNDGALQLNCSAQSHGIKLVSPAHSASQSYTLIFPDNQIAADKYLKVKSISGSGSTAIGQLEFEALDANDLGEGTIPDARFPSTLPALNGSALTNLNASNIASGTISSSRVPTLNQNTTGSAATLTTARNIAGVAFDGSQNISLNNNAITNGAGYITDLVNDTSPQLGGILDTNGQYITFDDNKAAVFGNGSDFQVYHSGSNNFVWSVQNHDLILRAGTADAYVQGSDVFIGNNGGSKKYIDAHEDTAVELYHNNVKKLETTANGATIDGGSNVSMDSSGNGQLKVNGNGYSGAIALDGSAMNIYTNSGSRGIKFGINEAEKVNIDTSGHLNIPNDSGRLRLGASADLQLYHTGSESYLSNTTGNLYIEGNTGQTSIQIVPDGAVDLRHSGNKKIETTSSGVTVTGTCTATTFSGSGASLTSIPAGNLTGTLPAISGANLTNLPGGGKVLQVVNSRLSSAFSTSSSSYTATGHTVSVSNIASASSKILIIASGTTINTGANGGRVALFKSEGGSYSNVASDYIATFWGEGNSNNVEGTSSFQFYDTAGSNYANGLTYQVYIRNWGGGTAYWSYRGNTASLTAIEISA